MTPSLVRLDDGSTPLEPEEMAQLAASNIRVRAELNDAEQAGVAAAVRWAFARRRPVTDVRFLRTLHRRMFAGVWQWAGAYRTTGRNIGVEAWRIAPEMELVVEETRHQLSNSVYGLDEIAARFHHALVLVHAFPNGNGRHARIAADLLLAAKGRPRFSWGGADLTRAGEARARYIAALRAADAHDVAPLLAFVRA